MNYRDMDLVQQSWEKVVPIADAAAQLFYGRLFELDPSLGVLDHHYADVGAALLWAIGDALGHDATPEVLSAWREAYDLLAAVMRRAAHAAGAPTSC